MDCVGHVMSVVIIIACFTTMTDETKSVTVGVQAIAIRRSTILARQVPHELTFGHFSINQSSGISWNEVHGISCCSHHWAYVVFDFFDMVLKGD